MSEQINDWDELKGNYRKAGIKLLSFLPSLILKERMKRETVTILTKIIPLFICILSAASITNLSMRANFYHQDWSSYLTGGGIAGLVPLTVYVALKIGDRYKVWVWVIAALFALMSAAIQIRVYLPPDYTWDGLLEAISFGAGVPIGECLLAAMEAFLFQQIKVEKDEAKKKEKEDKLEREREEEDRLEKERVRLQKEREAEAEREFNRRKKELELEDYALKLEQKRELEKLKAEGKLNHRDSKRDSVNQDESTVDSVNSVIEYFRINPKATQRRAADDLGLSQSKVNRILASKSVVKSNGVNHD